MSRHRTAAHRVRLLLRSACESARDGDALFSLSFSACFALDILHGETAQGFRPGAGGCEGAWKEVDAMRRADLRRLSSATLHRVAALSYRAAKMREAAFERWRKEKRTAALPA